MREPVPAFSLPLLPGDVEPTVELGAVLADLYETRSYDLMLDYRADPVPPLGEADAAWADGLLREAVRR